MPHFGGTNFDDPLHAAFDLRDFLKWKTVLVQLVTDGFCGIANRDAILARKRPRDQIAAVIVGGPPSNIDEVADTVYRIEKDGLISALVKVGNALL